MKGHIKQRSKGSWTLWVDLGRDPETGKRKQRTSTVRGTKKDAERELRELLHSLEVGSYVKPTRTTLGQWLEQWYQSYVAMHCSPRTAESYQSEIRRHLIPALGAIPLIQLHPQHLQDYYSQALTNGRVDGRGGLSARTVQYHHCILAEALGYAVKMEFLARNVAKAVDPPHPERTNMATLAPDDISTFLATAKKTHYYTLFYTALFTGMRRGELLALTWANIDLDIATISVTQTLHRLSNGQYVIRQPKSPHSRRQVDLPPTLALLLRQHEAEQELEKILVGKPLAGSDKVFSHPDGSPLDPHVVSHAFAKVLKKAGLPHIRFHDLRHTHATLLLKAGIHPKIVSERLGHANIGITLDTYSHVLPGLQKAAAERFDKMLEPGVIAKSVSNPLANDLGLDTMGR